MTRARDIENRFRKGVVDVRLIQIVHPIRRVNPSAPIHSDLGERTLSQTLILAENEGGHPADIATLLHPNFQVVLPRPSAVRQPLAFAVARSNEEFSQFLSQWIVLKKRGGDIDELFNHWILGRGAKSQRPRWSVIRDVLHWVD